MFDSTSVHHFTDLVSAYKDVAWQVLQITFLILLGLSVLRTLKQALEKMTGGGTRRVGKKYGLLQVNRGVKFERKRSLSSRRLLGLFQDNEDDGLTASPDASDAVATTTLADDGKDGGGVCAKTAAKIDAIALKAAAYASKKPVCWIALNNDTMASQRVHFAKCVDEVIANRDKFSRVVIAGSSPGGAAPMYGHMYYEMERLRNCSGLLVEFVSDWCAASGGYMQAAPAHFIYGPATAIFASIGVVANMMNYRKALENYGVVCYEETAGDFKRTLSPTGEVTDEKLAKFREDLAKVHAQFIAMVTKYRTEIDVAVCCNGAHFLGDEALKLHLIDGFASSQEMLFDANQKNDVIFLVENVGRFEKGIFRFLAKVADRALDRVLTQSPFGNID